MTTEDKFRAWAFHVYYQKLFATERDPDMRFVKAIVRSAAPMRHPELLSQWHAKPEEEVNRECR